MGQTVLTNAPQPNPSPAADLQYLYTRTHVQQSLRFSFPTQLTHFTLTSLSLSRPPARPLSIYPSRSFPTSRLTCPPLTPPLSATRIPIPPPRPCPTCRPPSVPSTPSSPTRRCSADGTSRLSTGARSFFRFGCRSLRRLFWDFSEKYKAGLVRARERASRRVEKTSYNTTH